MTTQLKAAFTAGEVLSASWRIVKRSWVNYLAVIGVTLLLYIGFAIVFGVLTGAGVPGWLEQVLSFLLAIYISIVTTKASLVIARGHKLELGKLMKFDSQMYLQATLVTVLLTVIILLGFVALVVPGIILALMFSFTLYSVVDENTDAMTALKHSRQLTTGNKWQMLTYYTLLGVFGVGIFSIGAVLMASGLGVSLKNSMSVGVQDKGEFLAILAMIIGLIFAVTSGILLYVVNLACHAYMYLKMREHSPAPKT